MSVELELTKEQRNAINALKRVAKRWPKGIWLFCNGITMAVLLSGERGEHVTGADGSMDQDYVVDHIDGIDHDGGDW